MSKLLRPVLVAILDAIQGIDEATFDKTIHDFSTNWLLRHGIQRGIEIISEASRRIPPDIQATQPQIPWVQLAAIGNILRHEYHRISDIVVWNVVEDSLPPLKKAILQIEANIRDE